VQNPQLYRERNVTVVVIGVSLGNGDVVMMGIWASVGDRGDGGRES